MASIEKEIKQESFNSEQHKSLVNVLYTANYLNNLVTHSLKEYKLSQEQFNVLRILRGSHPKKLRQKDILVRMLSPQSNLTLIIKKLIDKKLISLSKSTTDLRSYDIGITKYGINLLKKVDIKFEKAIKKINPLNDKEATMLNKLLDQMRSF